MEIRKLTEEDLPSLLELYAQLDSANAELQLEPSLKVWKEIEENKNIIYIGAVDQGKVVATCFAVIIPNLTNHNRPMCFIENVVTDQNYRKQGLGKKVIDEAIRIAKENNCYKAFLESGVQRTEAHKFYEKLGFNSDSKKAFLMKL